MDYPEIIPSYASSWEMVYPTAVTRLANGREKRLRTTTNPILSLSLVYRKIPPETLNQIISFYQQSQGKFHAFSLSYEFMKELGIPFLSDSTQVRMDGPLRVEVNEFRNYNVTISLTQVT